MVSQRVAVWALGAPRWALIFDSACTSQPLEAQPQGTKQEVFVFAPTSGVAVKSAAMMAQAAAAPQGKENDDPRRKYDLRLMVDHASVARVRAGVAQGRKKRKVAKFKAVREGQKDKPEGAVDWHPAPEEADGYAADDGDR